MVSSAYDLFEFLPLSSLRSSTFRIFCYLIHYHISFSVYLLLTTLHAPRFPCLNSMFIFSFRSIFWATISMDLSLIARLPMAPHPFLFCVAFPFLEVPMIDFFLSIASILRFTGRASTRNTSSHDASPPHPPSLCTRRWLLLESNSSERRKGCSSDRCERDLRGWGGNGVSRRRQLCYTSRGKTREDSVPKVEPYTPTSHRISP